MELINLALEAGKAAAARGEFRAAPTNYKLLSQEMRDWYRGFDEATRAGNNAKLTNEFRLRAKK